MIKLSAHGMHWRIEPQMCHCIGETSACCTGIRDDVVRCVGKPQYRSHSAVAHHDDKSDASTLGMLTRGRIASFFADWCSPTRREHGRCIEHPHD